jgi:hypothetical protein
MPEMNGRDLPDQLGAQFPDLKTRFMSGYTANVCIRGFVSADGGNRDSHGLNQWNSGETWAYTHGNYYLNVVLN